MNFYDDPYKKELDVEILKIKEDAILLNDTICYPGGGGQPSDSGWIEGDRFKARIKEAYKENEEVWHRLEHVEGTIGKIGKITIDWIRRYSLMKAHTGEHIFYKALETLYPVKFEKVEFGVIESTLFVNGKLTYSEIEEAENLANKIISESLPVSVTFESAEKIEHDVRYNASRIKERLIRVVTVGEFDKSACAGLHVKNTGEVEQVVVTKIKKSKFFEIKFRVAEYAKEFVRNSVNIARILEQDLNVTPEQLVNKVVETKQELDKLKKDYYDLTSCMFQFEKCPLGDMNFYFSLGSIGDFKGIEKRAHQIIESEPAIVLFGNENLEKIELLFSKNIDFNLSKIHEIMKYHNIKGGGKGNYLMLSVNAQMIKQIFEKIKDFIVLE